MKKHHLTTPDALPLTLACHPSLDWPRFYIQPRNHLNISSMSNTSVHVVREYHGLPPPRGYQTPTPAELVELCTAEHPQGYNMGLAHPPEAPVFWIKYGTSVIWNEVPAQIMAYEELRRMKSPVKAPGIFYACEIEESPGSGNCKSFIVRELILGKTADEWLMVMEDPARQDSIYSSIAFALSELLRIPITPESRPAAIDGGRIRHALFDCQEAPRHYQNVGQLEDHLNLVREGLYLSPTSII